MKNASLRLAPIALAAALPLAAAAAPETYAIDPIHSFPYFAVPHLGMSSIMGRFDRMTGTATLDRQAKTGSLDIKIPTAGVNTGDPKRADGQRSRDEHLRSADFFNSAEFPDMTYKSTKLHFTGDKLESVDGNLTLLGVTKPVKLTVTSFNCGAHPMSKKEMCGAEVTGTVKRSEFGMKTFIPAVGDDIRVFINIEAYKQ